MTRTQERRTAWLIGLVSLALFALVVATTAQTPGPPRNYTLSFEHDGVNTTGYEVLVDAVVTPVTVTCNSATPRVCSGPLTMTTNVSHTVIVKALGTFGEASSDPFGAAPPTRPGAVVVR